MTDQYINIGQDSAKEFIGIAENSVMLVVACAFS